MPLKCQNDYLKGKTPPGYFKYNRQIGYYFPKTGDFRAVSKNKSQDKSSVRLRAVRSYRAKMLEKPTETMKASSNFPTNPSKLKL